MKTFLIIQFCYWIPFITLNIILGGFTRLTQLEVVIISASAGVFTAIIGLIGTIIGATKSGNGKLIGFKGDLSKEHSELKGTLSKENSDLSKGQLKIEHLQDKIITSQSGAFQKVNSIYEDMLKNQEQMRYLNAEQSHIDMTMKALLRNWESTNRELVQLRQENNILIKENSQLKQELRDYSDMSKTQNRSHGMSL